MTTMFAGNEEDVLRAGAYHPDRPAIAGTATPADLQRLSDRDCPAVFASEGAGSLDPNAGGGAGGLTHPGLKCICTTARRRILRSPRGCGNCGVQHLAGTMGTAATFCPAPRIAKSATTEICRPCGLTLGADRSPLACWTPGCFQ